MVPWPAEGPKHGDPMFTLTLTVKVPAEVLRYAVLMLALFT